MDSYNYLLNNWQSELAQKSLAAIKFSSRIELANTYPNNLFTLSIDELISPDDVDTEEFGPDCYYIEGTSTEISKQLQSLLYLRGPIIRELIKNIERIVIQNPDINLEECLEEFTPDNKKNLQAQTFEFVYYVLRKFKEKLAPTLNRSFTAEQDLLLRIFTVDGFNGVIEDLVNPLIVITVQYQLHGYDFVDRATMLKHLKIFRHGVNGAIADKADFRLYLSGDHDAYYSKITSDIEKQQLYVNQSFENIISELSRQLGDNKGAIILDPDSIFGIGIEEKCPVHNVSEVYAVINDVFYDAYEFYLQKKGEI